MKDQYVGDVNDFWKYQLLRIARGCFDSVLVAWMLTYPDGRADGGRIRYLEDPSFRLLDPTLFDALTAIVRSGSRSVAAVEESTVLGDCEFVSETMPVDPFGRAEYFAKLAQLAGPDSLVFFDPDNGFEVPSVQKHRRGSERYLFWDELSLVRQSGASALIYQHFPRVHRGRFLRALLSRLQAEMGNDYCVFASHSSLVAFMFAVREERAPTLRRALRLQCQATALLKFVEGGKPVRPADAAR
jgi:hypothetical protein